MYKINYLPQFAQNGINIQDLRLKLKTYNQKWNDAHRQHRQQIRNAQNEDDAQIHREIIDYLDEFYDGATQDLRQQIRDTRQSNRTNRRIDRLQNRLSRIQGNENTPVVDENTQVIDEDRPATTDGLFSIPYLTLSLFPQPKPLLVRYLESMQPTTESTVVSTQPSVTTESTTVQSDATTKSALGNTNKTEEDLPLNTPIRIAPVSTKTIETTIAQPVKSDADYKQAVLDVIRGKYGNGGERLDKLNAAGFDPKKVQDAVNAKLGETAANTPTQDVIPGSRTDSYIKLFKEKNSNSNTTKNTVDLKSLADKYGPKATPARPQPNIFGRI